MKLQEVEMGLLSFAEKNIAPRLESDLDRLVLYFSGAAKLAQFEAQINKNAASLIEMDIMDADGEFNLDAIEKYGEIAFAKVPKVSFWKVKVFNQRDFKNLMNYLRHGNEQSPSGDAETGSMDNSI